MKKKLIIVLIALLVAGSIIVIVNKDNNKASAMTGTIQTGGLPSIDSFEIVGSGIATGNKLANSDTLLVVITHNLGYAPVVIAYITTAGGTNISIPFTATGAQSGSLASNGYIDQQWTVGSDSSTVRIIGTFPHLPGDAGSWAVASNYNFKYFLLREKTTR